MSDPRARAKQRRASEASSQALAQAEERRAEVLARLSAVWAADPELAGLIGGERFLEELCRAYLLEGEAG